MSALRGQIFWESPEFQLRKALTPTASTIYSKKTIENYCGKFNLNIIDMFDDIQVVPLARLLGFFRIPGILKTIKYLGLEKAAVKLRLLTGYSVCAVHTK